MSNLGEPLLVLLYVQPFLVIQFDSILAIPLLKNVYDVSPAPLWKSTAVQSSRDRGMQVIEENVLFSRNGVALAPLSRGKPKLLVVSPAVVSEPHEMHTRLAGGERAAHPAVENPKADLRPSQAAYNNIRQRLNEAKSYQSAAQLERQSRSPAANNEGGKKDHRKSIEHLPGALNSLRRLGTDLNILGNQLMGFHLPSYLRVFTDVVSLIL